MGKPAKCCCGGGTYNFVLYRRDNGMSGDSTPQPLLDKYNRRNRRWVHSTPKSEKGAFYRERINDFYIIDENNIFMEICLDDIGTEPDFTFGLPDREFRICNVTSTPHIKWVGPDIVNDNASIAILSGDEGYIYNNKRISGLLPDNTLVYFRSPYTSTPLGLVNINLDGEKIWDTDLSSASYNYDIRTGQKIIFTRNTPNQGQGNVLDIYSLSGSLENTVFPDAGINSGFTTVGLIDDNIYSVKYDSLLIEHSVKIQKRDLNGNLNIEIFKNLDNYQTNNGGGLYLPKVYYGCYNQYVYIINGREIIIYDQNLTEISQFILPYLVINYSFLKLIIIENDGIYGVDLVGNVKKLDWDGNIIWEKSYFSDRTDGKERDVFTEVGFTQPFPPAMSFGIDILGDYLVVGGNTFSIFTTS